MFMRQVKKYTKLTNFMVKPASYMKTRLDKDCAAELQ